jgi:hypothetical protein
VRCGDCEGGGRGGGRLMLEREGKGVLMMSEMMFVATEVKKTGKLAEEIH